MLLYGGKADANHYRTVSFKNCMLRVPASFNSKYVKFDHSDKIVYPINPESEVRVIKKMERKSHAAKQSVADKVLYPPAGPGDQEYKESQEIGICLENCNNDMLNRAASIPTVMMRLV